MVISSFRFVSTYVLAAEQTEPSRWKPVFDRMLSCGADPTLLNGGVECPNDVVQLALSFERLDILEQFGQMPLLLALDRLPAYQQSLPHHAGRPWAPGAAWLEKHYALSEQQSLSEETAPSPRSRAQLPRL